MENTRLSGITFRQIEIFLTVAKYENFTKAAQELYMSQASVSRNIQNLELTLGLVLFVRHKKRAVLTNAGKSLEKDFRQICQKTEKAVDSAFLQQKNQFCTLSIGDFSSTSMDSYLLPIINAFEKEHPELTLSIERTDPDALWSNMMLGKYDAMFILNAGRNYMQENGLNCDLLFHTPPCIVLSSSHPLFDKETISLADLRHLPLVAIQGGISRPYWEFVHQVCQEMELQPSDIKFVNNIYTLAMELKRDNRIAVMDACFAPINQEEIRYIPLPQCRIQSGVTLVYSKDNVNPYLTEFRKFCMETGCKLIRFPYEHM